ncbi:ANL family adenylate-forming protein [Pseudomonas fluorescens]|uniref:ANL family adenylate-forming protein n=1 Tax=Pseudomonas fluorescens TaxID=294 RepID=UPI001BEBD7AD|nr:fatty acid--CoA ligase family protein [Pseudomonas fluorescens]MBT2372359.1 long-chain fatty acid--CoA ligase [Pseudomonas fluorescens]
MLLEMLSNIETSEKNHEAIVLGGETCRYRELETMVRQWLEMIPILGISPGQCVALTGTMSISMIAAMMALEEAGNIVFPLVSERDLASSIEEAYVDFEIRFDGRTFSCNQRERKKHSQLIESFLSREASSGLLFLTSGSTGKKKVVLHDFRRLISSVKQGNGKASRIMIFLMLDHIGGMNSLLYALCHGGTAVFAGDRSVGAICSMIEQCKVEVLPATPTFLRMMAISFSLKNYDLSSLHTITYGTEPMHPTTLQATRRMLPSVKFKQTYGMTEAGILPTQSRNSDSVWMKIGGPQSPIKVVEGVLWIKSPVSMIGYLNAASIVDDQGWINTGDHVEVDGDYVHVLGRISEIINVAGEKVYPQEVESVILGMANVVDVTVTSRRNPVTCEVVVALVQTEHEEDTKLLQKRVRTHCQQSLRPFQVPAIVMSTTKALYGIRFKKIRGIDAS